MGVGCEEAGGKPSSLRSCSLCVGPWENVCPWGSRAAGRRNSRKDSFRGALPAASEWREPCPGAGGPRKSDPAVPGAEVSAQGFLRA